jgi:hypothetical protein
MAHYARLNEQNIVDHVIVVANSDEPTEADGVAFCQNLFGGGTWKKTSYNGNIRKNFAGPGFSYDVIRDAFIAPKPYPSWLLNESTCRWEAPVQQPTEFGFWHWDEITTSWVNLA